MTDINALKSMLENLDHFQLDDISNYIFTIMTARQDNGTFEFSNINNGITCPKCDSTNCVKNGKKDGKQRFVCKGCSKTFGTTSGSAIAHTKLSQAQWMEYIRCMVDSKSIRESAEIVRVCVKTSFYMRHKILDAIRAHMDKGKVSGIIEIDETFLAESFKGNHKKSGFKMPRKPRKRGKEVTKRGISNEQICVGSAIDKNGNVVMEMVCKGRVTSKKLEKLYDGCVSKGSIICTDSYSGYKTLAKKMELSHKRIPSGKHSDGIFGLSGINSLHSRFKRWIRTFNGVSTKFLPNYLYWFKWLESAKNTQPSAKPERLRADAMAKRVDVGISVLRKREAVWV